METSYWVAAHLTGIFEIRDQSKNILRKGSLGAGISLNRGVKTTIKQIENSEIRFLFDGKQKTANEAIVTNEVINLLDLGNQIHNVQISHNFEIPLSSGYGASAAGAIGTAYAVNDFLELELSNLDLFQTAHKAEVLTKSGLGDVIGLYQGGLEIRTKEGAPGIGETIPMMIDEDWKIATIHIGPLSTSEVLSNSQKRERINIVGKDLISQLVLYPKFSNFIKFSSIFSQKVNLWSNKLKKLLRYIPNEIVVSQIMLGDGLFLFYQDKAILTEINIPNVTIHTETICQDTVVKVR